MQTYTGLVRNPADATLIFEACRQGKLPRIQRRLSDRERNAIRSGSIFVWDEKEAGMRRWTDGKSWSASRVAGSFLTYREMEGKRAVGDIPQQSRANGGHSGDESDEPLDATDGQKYELTESYKYKVDGLIKQSFSITTSEDQKLHLISYFGRQHPNNAHLRSPAQDPALMHIQIPRGLYPESTLELPMPTGPRLEDHRYAMDYPPPLPPSQQQQPPPQQQQQHYPLYAEPGWDPRHAARPREIRPNHPQQLYDQARDMPLSDLPPGPYQPMLHHPSLRAAPPPPPPPPLHAIQQPPSPHSRQPSISHALHAHHGAVPAPPGLLSSAAAAAAPPPPLQQASLAPAHAHPHAGALYRPYPRDASMHGRHSVSYGGPGPMRSPRSDTGRGLHHPPPHQDQHPVSLETATRRSSLTTRSHESPRRLSAPQFTTTTKGVPYGGDPPPIAIPDLNSAVSRLEASLKPFACDIPSDKLGRWQEDVRALDALRHAMNL